MTKNTVIRRCCSTALLLFLAGSANAYEVIVAKVTLVESSYMPNTIVFKIDKSLPSCPAGTFIKWEHSAENNKAVFASLLTAMASGRRVTLHIADGDTACRGLFLHGLDY